MKKPDTWKIQLTIPINFIFSKDNDEECVMHSKSDNIRIMIKDKADEITTEPLQSLLFRYRYQIEMKTSMGSSDFIFDCVHLLYYKCHKINLKRS